MNICNSRPQAARFVAGVRRFDFDGGLAPYDLGACASWHGLSRFINSAVIQRLLPVCSAGRLRGGSAGLYIVHFGIPLLHVAHTRSSVCCACSAHWHTPLTPRSAFPSRSGRW